MSEIIIKFDSEYNLWKKEIDEKLDEHNVYRRPRLVDILIQSILSKLKVFLESEGYRPNKFITYSYRKYLSKELKISNTYIEIMSNRLLWLYLEYFLDLTDYYDCFDVNIRYIE